MNRHTDPNYRVATLPKKNFHYILANFGWILKLDKIGKFLLMIDFVDAFFRSVPTLVLVSRLCSVNITSVSWNISIPVPLRSLLTSLYLEVIWLYILSIFFARYSLWITSFSFYVKTSSSSLESLSHGWLRTSTALSLFLGSTCNKEWIRLTACSVSLVCC